MHIAIIGTGRVGSALALCLVNQVSFEKLTLINRSEHRAKGLYHDLMGTVPKLHKKIAWGGYEQANDADIVIVTAGAFGAPAGSSLWDANKQVIDKLFTKYKPKPETKILVTSTPIDRIAKHIQKITGLKPTNIIGFGGQLDVHRLQFLLLNAGHSPKNAYFIGEHGARGIAIFDAAIQDRQQFSIGTRSFFKNYLADYKASTAGTAQELTHLVKALLLEEETDLCISYFEEKYDLYITWPCSISKKQIVPKEISLSEEQQDEFEALVKTRQQEEC